MENWVNDRETCIDDAQCWFKARQQVDPRIAESNIFKVDGINVYDAEKCYHKNPKEERLETE